jgi:hypothetical protein
MKRKIIDQKALIPKNLNIHRRSTKHTRVEKSFEDAYNCSPRSRVAKMKAARKLSQSRPSSQVLITSESPNCARTNRKFLFNNNSNAQNEMLERMSNLCQKERANTNKLLSQMSGFRKIIENDLNALGQFKGEECRHARGSKILKENVI